MVAKLLCWWLSYAALCLTINAGYNRSLEFIAVNSHLAGLLEEGEHQPSKFLITMLLLYLNMLMTLQWCLLLVINVNRLLTLWDNS